MSTSANERNDKRGRIEGMDLTTDPTLNMLTSASLCFDRLDFARRDFSVERFLLKSRAGGHPFERIRDDLRVLLRIVQNSMIELINKDYADFVNLSSNLVGLAAVIDKLKSATSDLSTELSDISSRIDVAVHSLGEKFDERRSCAEQQKILRQKIEIFSNMKRLNALLDSLDQNEKSCDDFTTRSKRLNFYVERILLLYGKNCDKVDKSDFEHFLGQILTKYQNLLEKAFVSEIKSSKNVASLKVQRNLAVLLDSFDCCGRLDAGLACFLNEFIDNEFRSKFPNKKFNEKQQADNLQRLLLDLAQCQMKYSAYFAHSNHTTFICDCLLTYLLNFLDERCSNLFFSTDVSAFRTSYYALCEFFTKNFNPDAAMLQDTAPDVDGTYKPGPHSSASLTTCANTGLIRMIFQKFNVGVYYQLKKKEILEKLTKSFNSAINETVALLKAKQPSLLSNGAADESSAVLDSFAGVTSLDQREEGFGLTVTEEAFLIIKSIWSSNPTDNGVFLPCLASKCLELCFIVLNMYEQFMQMLGSQLLSETAGAKDSAPLSLDPSAPLVVDPAPRQPRLDYRPLSSTLLLASHDSHRLASVLATSHFPAVQSTFLAALARRGDQLRATSRELVERCVFERALAEASAASALVAEVPRRYRWTRKEAPERPSIYVAQTVAHLRFLVDGCRCSRFDSSFISEPNDDFLVAALNRCARTYADQLGGVLCSVDRITSSLTKLKRGGASSTKLTQQADATSGTTMTDDEKIRSQLRLDVAEFRRLADGLGLNDWDAAVLENLLGENREIV